MRNIFGIFKLPVQDPVYLHEYQSHGPRIEMIRQEKCDNSYPTCIIYDQVTLSVVFDGETQRHFSSVRFVVYCDLSRVDQDFRDIWGLRRSPESVVVDRPADHVSHTPRGDPSLPELTIAFEVLLRYEVHCYVLTAPSSINESLRRMKSHSASIIFESKHSITPNTLSVSTTFEHSNLMFGSASQFETLCGHAPGAEEWMIIRTVRVIPVDGAGSRTTIQHLPTELLLKIFEYSNSCAWQHDLLSFAQVCRHWSRCSMSLLFARLETKQWKDSCPYRQESHCLDICVFGKALDETPALGLGLQHLDVDHNNAEWLFSTYPILRRRLPSFVQALLAVLNATKNLQSLDLSLGYTSRMNVFFSAPPTLRHLHALSITRTPRHPDHYCTWIKDISWEYSISTVQLARCMAHWPSLTSLTVKYLKSENISTGRFFSRPPASPACALTQLCIRHGCLSDKDLLYLTASSANTLTQVTLDDVSGISDEGLGTFLDAISRNVISLTISNVLDAEGTRRNEGRSALDMVVDRMWCLQELNVRGDVASKHMLYQRSKVFARSKAMGVPVVRLSFQEVPRLENCTDQEWAGWEVVGVC